MRSLNSLGAIMLFFSVLLSFPGAAEAYLDPGSGSFFFQILIGAVLSAAVSLRLYWGRVANGMKSLFAILFRNDPRR